MTSQAVAPETSPIASRVHAFFRSSNVRAYAVGGFVRDALLGRPTGDIDIAVEGGVSEVAEALAVHLGGSVFGLDDERDMHRVVLPGGHVDLTPVRGGSIEADLALRDFTINAMAVPIEDMVAAPDRMPVLDPLGGRADLAARTVRLASTSAVRDDPLRALRAVRLAAELGFRIEAVTQALIRESAASVAAVPGERVRDELCRILAAPGALASLRLMDSLRMLVAVLPELEESRGVSQPREHYWDVLDHSLECVGALEQVLRQSPAPAAWLDQVPWDEAVARYFWRTTGGAPEGGGVRTRLVLGKLAALLHDVAKPATKTVDPDGRMRFHGHPAKGAGMMETIMRRLRFSAREVRIVSVIVQEHLRAILISREGPPTRRALYRFFRDAEGAVPDTLYLSFADYLAARGPLLDPDDWSSYSAKLRFILESWRTQESAAPQSTIIDGHDIMRAFHLPPGPRIGRLLAEVKEARAAGEINSKEDALAFVRHILGQATARPARGQSLGQK